MTLSPISLWEIIALLIIVYLMFRPDLLSRITKFKVGNFELELSEIKKQIEEGKEKISELEDKIKNERRQFDELLNQFDANAPLNELLSVRQAIRSQSKNISDIELFRQLLTLNSTSEELYATAVGIREK